jgi:iron(II)-dependent oxidoreductase
MIAKQSAPTVAELFDALVEARERTLELISDLDDDQMVGPRLAIVNPLRWEVAHVAWFQERWLLRHLNRREPVRADGDSLYDSARVAHDTRWDLPLPSKEKTLDYVQEILRRALDLRDDPRARQVADDGHDLSYFLHLVLFHEYMHAEAITYTRQTLIWKVKPCRWMCRECGAMLSYREENFCSAALKMQVSYLIMSSGRMKSKSRHFRFQRRL